MVPSPLVSTLICTYNAEKFIDTTLLSVLHQTYQQQEVLIYDDKSSDSTMTVLKKYQEKYPQIRIFTAEKKLWPYGWLNFLMEQSTWKYIAIQDHDDIWHPEKLSIQVDFLERNEWVVWSGTATLMYYWWKSKVWFLYDTKDRYTSKVIHTSLVFRNDWYRYDVSNDFLCDGYFMQKILSKDKPVLKVHKEPLTLHYYKENWGNYSEQRFVVNWKNVRRYFHVYWYNRYFVFLFCYILFCKLFPYSVKNKFDFALLKTIKWAKPLSELRKEKVYLSPMLAYYP